MEREELMGRSKGQGCQITESTQNLKMVCAVFKRFARIIHKEDTPKEANFLKISIECAKIGKSNFAYTVEC